MIGYFMKIMLINLSHLKQLIKNWKYICQNQIYMKTESFKFKFKFFFIYIIISYKKIKNYLLLILFKKMKQIYN